MNLLCELSIKGQYTQNNLLKIVPANGRKAFKMTMELPCYVVPHLFRLLVIKNVLCYP